MLKAHFQGEHNALERSLFSKIDIHIAYKYIDKHCDDHNKMLPFCSRKEVPYFCWEGRVPHKLQMLSSVCIISNPPHWRCLGPTVALLCLKSLGFFWMLAVIDP